MNDMVKTKFDSVCTDMRNHNIYFTSFFFPTEKICDNGFFIGYSSNVNFEKAPLEMCLFSKVISDIIDNFNTFDTNIRKRLSHISDDLDGISGFLSPETIVDLNIKDEYELLFADKINDLRKLCQDNDYNFFFQVLLEIRQDGDSVESNRQTVGAIKEIHPFGNADLKTLSWHKCLLFQSLALHMLLPEDKKDIRELNLNMLKSRLLIS